MELKVTGLLGLGLGVITDRIHYMELKDNLLKHASQLYDITHQNPLHGVERSPSRPPGASLPAANPLHGIESWNPPLSESI